MSAELGSDMGWVDEYNKLLDQAATALCTAQKKQNKAECFRLRHQVGIVTSEPDAEPGIVFPDKERQAWARKGSIRASEPKWKAVVDAVGKHFPEPKDREKFIGQVLGEVVKPEDLTAKQVTLISEVIAAMEATVG